MPYMWQEKLPSGDNPFTADSRCGTQTTVANGNKFTPFGDDTSGGWTIYLNVKPDDTSKNSALLEMFKCTSDKVGNPVVGCI